MGRPAQRLNLNAGIERHHRRHVEVIRLREFLFEEPMLDRRQLSSLRWSLPEKTSRAQLSHSLFHLTDEKLDVLISVRGRKEAIASFPNVNPLFEQVIEEEIHERELVRVGEPEE